ncbi:FliM/FliN family flagellar motor switch protein [Acidomonas methanolica]|uniref:FliM/FliN family flagellar motor switch protein n=1 Tax=Acidomonas methanolica TaxID=437 RepID=UPI00211A6DB3|nr:FliM/FliN family flagellar motor switch protein [Acidomonas methanolica]MCQ9156272.1 FliM/FliN family flagellar motor switch protein [Acidomonas methanolica]
MNVEDKKMESNNINENQFQGSTDVIYEIPVTVTAVLGRVVMPISQVVKLGRGAIVELNRKVGEDIEVHINNKIIARGEIVILDDNKIGITMSEIIKKDSSAVDGMRGNIC